MENQRGKKAQPCPTIQALKVASQDEAKAVEFMEAKRWPNGAECPYCQGRNVYQMRTRGTDKREKNYRWRCKPCKQMFTVRTGTVMEQTRLPLRVWCLAFWRSCSSKKGVSSLQISREASISYKSALFLTHRIRYAMNSGTSFQELMTGEIETDETYVGGKPRFRSKERNQGMYHTRKQTVVAMVQRDGQARVRHVRRHPYRRLGMLQVQDLLKGNVSPDAQLFTDESQLYKWAKNYFTDHQSVNHRRGQYTRKRGHGKPLVTTNSVEGFFSLIKRGIFGTFHSVSPAHLHRYLSEFEFRHNARHIPDGPRVNEAIASCAGKRLRYIDYVDRELV